MKNIFASMLCLVWLVATSLAFGKRPEGVIGGVAQMDIAQMEKDLGRKFAVGFPSERFDIDYFYQGDLLLRTTEGGGSIAATCPFVVGPMVAFALGTGASAESLKLTGEVNIDFGDEGEVLRCSLRAWSGMWPEKTLNVSPVDGESEEGFQRRLLAKWLEAASQAEDAETAIAQVRLAMELVRVTLKQGGAQKK